MTNYSQKIAETGYDFQYAARLFSCNLPPMKKHFLPALFPSLFALILPLFALAQDRSQISQWLQEGNWDAVVSAAQANPDTDFFLLQSAGYASYQLGDKAQSEEYFSRLLASDSNNRQALYYSAAILKADENYAEAIPLLRRLCGIKADVSQYQVMLADCYSESEEYVAAAKHLKIARTLSPSSIPVANKLANAFIRLKAYDSATNLLNSAMNEHPRQPVLISTAINLAYTRKQYARASALTDSLIRTGKLRYESLITGLYSDISLPNYAHAVELGNIIMAMDVETEEVMYYTALAYQHLKRWDEADTLLRKCVRRVLKPNLEAYYLGLAEGAAVKKDWTRCKAYYDTAYYLFKNPVTLYRKGLALQSSGKNEEAKQAYKRYLSLPIARQDTAISKYLKKKMEE